MSSSTDKVDIAVKSDILLSRERTTMTNQPMSGSRIKQIVDRYQDLRANRQGRATEFLQGRRSHLIFQTPGGNVWGDARTSEDSFERNLQYIADSLEVPSDHLPVLEPWFGTGVYASIFGCPYMWRQGAAPAVHYRYHELAEVRGLARPRWQDSEIAQLVLRTIDYFKSRTGDALPIVWTDTQSAHDTATLVLDASEVFLNCLIEPAATMDFLRIVNDVIIEFSRVQAERIGAALLCPGHIMLSAGGFGGMSISDDNLAVGSPDVNTRFNLPMDEDLGRAMGGVAIHSCGKWDHTMPMLHKLVPSLTAVDLALDKTWDPNPNVPELVRDALAGTGIHVHARVTGQTEEMVEIVKRIMCPNLKLVVHPMFIDLPTAQRNYEALERLLG
jgi:hypothetical protein